MHRPINYVAAFLVGVACTFALIALPGASKPGQQERRIDTQIVPIGGGLALMLSIHDHEKNRLYLYLLPLEKDGKVQLRGNVDLSASGQPQLPAELGIAD